MGNGDFQHAGVGWKSRHCLRYHTYIYYVRNNLHDGIEFAYGGGSNVGNGKVEIMGRIVDMYPLKDEQEVENYEERVDIEEEENCALITEQQLTDES